MLVPFALLATARDRLIVRGRNDISLPAADERDVPLGTRGGLSAAAIDDGISQHAARLRHVDRLDERERRDVFDLAPRIAWRKLDVGDDRVLRIVGIELAVNLSGDLLEGADAFGARGSGDGCGLHDLERARRWRARRMQTRVTIATPRCVIEPLP